MAKTPAQIQKDWRDKQRAKPLLEQLGYPGLAQRYANRVEDLEKMILDLQNKAEQLNLDIRQDLILSKTSDRKIQALSRLMKTRRVNIKTF